MGIPNKTKKLFIEEKVAKAVQLASGEEKIAKTVESGESEKKIGRKPLAGDRTSKITFYLSEDTEKRFNVAILQEQMKLAQKNTKTDKSFIIETALKEWMDRNGYGNKT